MPKNKPIISNPAKTLLQDGQPIIGMAVFEYLRPSLIKIASMAGFDQILVDMEHGSWNMESLTNFMVSARDNNLTPIVTVVSPERSLVSKMLDSGALGIILSHTETVDQVHDLIRWAKYAPDGERGIALGPNAEYNNTNVAQYCRDANDSILILPKIESPEGIRNAEGIMNVPGVDGIVFGPGDLSVKMGHAGESKHPQVVEALESVVQLAIEHGIPVEPAIMPTDASSYKRERARGAQIFGATRQSEYDLLKKAAQDVMEIYT